MASTLILTRGRNWKTVWKTLILCPLIVVKAYFDCWVNVEMTPRQMTPTPPVKARMAEVLRAYFTNYHCQLINKAVLRAWDHLHLLYTLVMMAASLPVMDITGPILIGKKHQPSTASTHAVFLKPKRRLLN
jgi:hypothetical protein